MSTLISVGPFQFPTIGLFVIFAALVFLYLVFLKAEEELLPVEKVFDLVGIAILSGLIFGKISGVLLQSQSVNLWASIFGTFITLKFISPKSKFSAIQLSDILSLASIPAITVYSLGKLLSVQFSSIHILILIWFAAGAAVFFKASKKVQFAGFYLSLAAIFVSIAQIVTEVFEGSLSATRSFNLTVSTLVLTFSVRLYYLKSGRRFREDVVMIGGGGIKTLEKVKRYLFVQRKTLEAQIAKLKKDDPLLAEGREQSREPGDDAYELEGHERITVVSQDLKRALFQVKKALAAVGLGKYGKCEACGTKIDSKRLQVYPQATLCLSCEQKVERI